MAAKKKTVPKKTAAKTATAKNAPPAVQAGNPAPQFSLPGDDGKTHSLSDHLGQPVVLYFYPKDDTPGCTREACAFRDNIARVQGAGAVLYGVSKDSLASHDKFREKYQLNFPLLSDTDLSVHKAYGAWGMKTMYGQTKEGTIRSTFLIDRDGKLARVWPKVQVDGHADEVIEALGQLT